MEKEKNTTNFKNKDTLILQNKKEIHSLIMELGQLCILLPLFIVLFFFRSIFIFEEYSK